MYIILANTLKMVISGHINSEISIAFFVLCIYLYLSVYMKLFQYLVVVQLTALCTKPSAKKPLNPFLPPPPANKIHTYIYIYNTYFRKKNIQVTSKAMWGRFYGFHDNLKISLCFTIEVLVSSSDLQSFCIILLP